ncbi:MAG: lipopolysaccharide heptosyltransferase II [Candidatus Marinimicrobia bacterium]|jgi:heptosyltransferase II|nr:lipopolysaccharide heptosyltransferase II [Candidatus Neomarinimicrobiota bacterium]
MKILIELPSWLGDVVMATPAIENLINHYNDAEINIIGSNSSIELLSNHPKVSSFTVLKKKYYSLFKTAINLGKFDSYFSFRQSFRSRVFKFLILSSQKYQFNKNHYVNMHQVEKYNSFINDAIKKNYKAGKLIINKQNNSDLDKSNRILGINPGASYGSSKRWYPEKFAEVAFELSSQYEIIIFGGPDEKNIALDIEDILINKGVLNYRNLAGKTSISELIEYISKLDLFISGDSGPMHIAASFQIPTVAIFGPTRDEETSQWKNENSKIVKKSLPCQPCMKRKCPLMHHNCMRMIHAKDIINLVESIN